MKNYRCKCGRHTATGSMSPPLCFACETCHMRLSPINEYGPPLPHNFAEQAVETDGGQDRLTTCVQCGKSLREIKTQLWGDKSVHWTETPLYKQISAALKDTPLRFAIGRQYGMLVADGPNHASQGEKYAEEISARLAPLGIELNYSGFDDEDYVYDISPAGYGKYFHELVLAAHRKEP